MNLSEKYRPRSEKDILCKEAETIGSFIKNYKPGSLLLVVGPPGCGKTSTVLAVASDREVLELNASSYRDRGSVHDIMGSFCSQMSLFGKKKLVLIDDIDAFSGRHDQGGIAEISRILETCRVPVVATATVLDDEKMASVLKRAD